LKHFFFDASGKVNVKRPFLIGNLGLFVIVFMLVIMPYLESWRSAARLIAHQQLTYDMHTTDTQFFYDTQADIPINILPYTEIVAALDSIHSLAHTRGLTVISLKLSNPTLRDTSDMFVDIRGTATIEGPAENFAIFINEISNHTSLVRHLHMAFYENGTSRLVLEFSLFANTQS